MITEYRLFIFVLKAKCWMKESGKKVLKRFLKTKEVLRRAESGVLNRDAAVDLGK